MSIQNMALFAAGAIGASVALIHGIVMQRYIVRPIEAGFRSGAQMNVAAQRLTPILLHLTTIYWFFGGLALIAAALWFEESARLAIAGCVAAIYLPAALGNLWGTRGRHPGWILYGLSVGLIGYAVFG